MKLECPNCGSEYPDLPVELTEHQARLALRMVMLWYGESPIREIQMASDMCGIHFPIRQIEAALSRIAKPRQDAIDWLRSSLVTLLTLAEADRSPLTPTEVATICKHTLAKYGQAPDSTLPNGVREVGS